MHICVCLCVYQDMHAVHGCKKVLQSCAMLALSDNDICVLMYIAGLFTQILY